MGRGGKVRGRRKARLLEALSLLRPQAPLRRPLPLRSGDEAEKVAVEKEEEEERSRHFFSGETDEAAAEEEDRSFLRHFFLDEPEEVAAEEKRRRREQQEEAYRKALREKKERRDALRKIFMTQPAPPLQSFIGLLSYRWRTYVLNERVQKEEKDEEEEEEELMDMEPLFYDEEAALAEYAAGEERREQKRKQKEQEAREKEMRLLRWKFNNSVLDSIRQYDHRSKRRYCTRLNFIDFSTFDLDEESPLGPMRHTGEAFYLEGTVCKRGQEQLLLFHSVNVLSVKVAHSNVGFPVNVYGTVIARDSLDIKCVYLFRRDRNHCQLINSKDDLLILTGPKRGLALRSDIYFEVDLKIKGEQGQKDKQFSKGFLELDAMQRLSWAKMRVESKSLDTKLSVLEVTFVVVPRAVEATVAAEVVEGEFDGKITACTSAVRDHHRLVLHDSKVAGVTNCPDGKRLVHMLRPTVAVFAKEALEITVAAQTCAGEVEKSITLTPGASGVAKNEITCGSIKMLVEVSWSIIACLPYVEEFHAVEYDIPHVNSCDCKLMS